MVIARPSRRPPHRETNGCLARPDRRVTLRLSGTHVAVGRTANDPPAVLNAMRTEPLSRTNHGNLLLHISSRTIHCERRAFSRKVMRQRRKQKNNARPARWANSADRKPARAPHRNASRQLKSCKSPSTAKSEALKPSKQTCYRSSSPYQNTSQQQGRFTGHSNAASGAQVPQVAAKEERRVLHVRERRFERRDGVPGRRAASTRYAVW